MSAGALAALTPARIAERMDGRLRQTADGRWEALLPSPCVQNHAAFLSSDESVLQCLWFGGSLEGRADVSIRRASLVDDVWQTPELVSDDPRRSEQNPVQFNALDGRCLVFHTAQSGGDQDGCVVRMREEGAEPMDLPLPAGSFIRGAIMVRHDHAWLLPIFRCVPREGYRWTGAHDTAAVAISSDAGASWREVDVPESVGCVHMQLVDTGNDRLIAFFRRRQADFVYRSESADAGEHWSSPQATDVPNNNSSISVSRLNDGRIALACNPVNAAMYTQRRASLYDELDDDPRPNARGGCDPVWGVPRAPLAICLSEDEGRTFPHRLIVDNASGACLGNDSLDGNNQELSYPSMRQNGDADIDIAYTFFRRAIKHVRISMSHLEQACT